MRTPPLSEEIKAKVLAKTATETPPNATHWSVRSMAKVAFQDPQPVGDVLGMAGAGVLGNADLRAQLSGAVFRDEFFGSIGLLAEGGEISILWTITLSFTH